MRTFLSWFVAFLIALVALVGLITFLNSRDQSQVDQNSAVTDGPGDPYKGKPVLSAALKDAVRRGNVVVLYHGPKAPPGIQKLVPPGGKTLERAGQSVVVVRAPTLRVPLAAVSAKRILEANQPRELQPFIDYWLGGGSSS